MSVTAREAALNALLAYRKRSARPDMVLSNLAKSEGLDRRDISFAFNIVNGVLQNEMFLDYYIEVYSGRKQSYFDRETLEILRISAYQLWFLDKVPAHAAVSEAVSLAGRRAKGIVNAVLRKLPTNIMALPEIEAGSREEKLSITYSHPIWLVKRLSEAYGDETCEAILSANNTPAPVSFILNTLKCGGLDGDFQKSEILDNAYYITGNGSVDGLDVFQKGYAYVQDIAAYLAVLAAGPKKGDTVLDTCAAPGGKSFAAAIMMENEGRIISRDIHEKKLRLISEGAERLGIDIIETHAADGREASPELLDKCDVVITDVPCSGIGVIRKKPEIRYKAPEELERLPEIQLSILRASAKCVRPGGTLLYSTCTILKEENESVISEFLRDSGEFSLEPFSLPEPFGRAEGIVTILPHISSTDGFFICKMRRKTT